MEAVDKTCSIALWIRLALTQSMSAFSRWLFSERTRWTKDICFPMQKSRRPKENVDRYENKLAPVLLSSIVVLVNHAWYWHSLLFTWNEPQFYTLHIKWSPLVCTKQNWFLVKARSLGPLGLDSYIYIYIYIYWIYWIILLKVWRR